MSADLRNATVCAGIVFLSLLAWAIVTPAFQAPDEPTHLAYIQRLAETGKAPRPSDSARPALSAQGRSALEATRFSAIIGNPLGKPAREPADVERARALLDADASQDDGGGAAAYSSYPPLYYALGAGPYLAADAAGATLVGSLTAVRLLSCLLSALTVLLLFLFAREIVPSTRAAWPTAALGVGLMPYFGFIGSSVNNDVLVATISAAVLLVIARSMRHGLTVRRAVSLGLLCAAGVITKPTFYGLIPGILLAVAFVVTRAWRTDRATAPRAATAVLLSFAAPVALYAALNYGVWGRSLTPRGTGLPDAAVVTSARQSVSGLLSYVGQFWLPRAWFLNDQVDGVYPLWETMFKGYAGRFGWLDYAFPGWVFNVVLAVWVMLLGLVVRALVICRAALRGRVAEVIVYTAMVLGLIVVIGVPGYDYRLSTGYPFEQARYLFPLLGLHAALIALAVRGAGARIGAYLAPSLILLTAALNTGGLLITFARYYS